MISTVGEAALAVALTVWGHSKWGMRRSLRGDRPADRDVGRVGHHCIERVRAPGSLQGDESGIAVTEAPVGGEFKYAFAGAGAGAGAGAVIGGHEVVASGQCERERAAGLDVGWVGGELRELRSGPSCPSPSACILDFLLSAGRVRLAQR